MTTELDNIRNRIIEWSKSVDSDSRNVLGEHLIEKDIAFLIEVIDHLSATSASLSFYKRAWDKLVEIKRNGSHSDFTIATNETLQLIMFVENIKSRGGK